MKKKNTKNYKNHILNYFNKISSIKGLEFRIIKNKLICTYWLSSNNVLNNFEYTLSNYLNIDLLFKNNKKYNLDFIFTNDNYEIILTELKHIYNLILGILKPYKNTIEIFGTGFKFNLVKNIHTKTIKILIYAGFSKVKIFFVPFDIKIELHETNTLILYSHNKPKLNQLSALIKQLRPLSLYKKRGINLNNEKIKLKIYKKK